MKELCWSCRHGKTRMEMVAPSVSATVVNCKTDECVYEPNKREAIKRKVITLFKAK